MISGRSPHQGQGALQRTLMEQFSAVLGVSALTKRRSLHSCLRRTLLKYAKTRISELSESQTPGMPGMLSHKPH